MAFAEHYRLQFGGTLYGSEIWSCTLNLGLANAPQPGFPTSGQMDDYVQDCRAFIGSNAFPSVVVLNYVKLNRIGTDGRYASATTSNTRFLTGSGTAVTNVAVGASAARPIPQASLALTLFTDRERGAGSRGRIFLPCPAATATVSTDGRLGAGDVGPVSTVGQNAGAFLAAINNLPGFDAGAGPRICVASQGGRGLPSPENVTVTAWGIGRVVDTMRSRRNALIEATARNPL
jgi:hypothetical protein